MYQGKTEIRGDASPITLHASCMASLVPLCPANQTDQMNQTNQIDQLRA